MKNFGIELNGVANIKMLMDHLLRGTPSLDECHITMAKIYQQLDLLERYMVEVQRAVSEDRSPAYWHEVREHKDKYPLNGGR